MNSDEIKGLAELSRLELSDTDIIEYQKDFEGILEYINTINSVEVDDYDDHVRSMTTNIMRADTDNYESGIYSEVLLKAAPTTDGDYIKVNKIL